MLAQETSDKAHPPWLGTRGPFQFRPGNMLNHEPKPSSTCPCTSRNGTKCSTITVRFYSCFLLSLSLSRFSSVSRPGRIIREWIPSVVPSVGHPLVIIVSLVHRNCARLYEAPWNGSVPRAVFYKLILSGVDRGEEGFFSVFRTSDDGYFDVE